MSTPTPTFGMRAPTPATPFNKLGAELLQMCLDIDATLAGFDYNGADPNLLAARVVALENARTLLQNRVTVLENRVFPVVKTGTYAIPGAIGVNIVAGPYTVNFSTPFSTIPFISFSQNDLKLSVAIQSVSTTQLVFYVANYSNAGTSGGSVVNWRAEA